MRPGSTGVFMWFEAYRALPLTPIFTITTAFQTTSIYIDITATTFVTTILTTVTKITATSIRTDTKFVISNIGKKRDIKMLITPF